jgi:hypothetical protein
LEQDHGLRARSVLAEQSLALKEDRHRTNSLESTGKMPTSDRRKGQRSHPQLLYRNGQALFVDSADQDLVARHQDVVAKRKLGGLRKRQIIRPKLKNAIKLRPS